MLLIEFFNTLGSSGFELLTPVLGSTGSLSDDLPWVFSMGNLSSILNRLEFNDTFLVEDGLFFGSINVSCSRLEATRIFGMLLVGALCLINEFFGEDGREDCCSFFCVKILEYVASVSG